MCGLIGWVGAPPREAIEQAIRAASARGPHSHGWAAPSTGARRLGAGGLGPCPFPGEGLVLGHSRLATNSETPGTLPDPRRGQPVRRGGWWLAHNGTSSDPRVLALATREPRDTTGLLGMVLEGDLSVLEGDLYSGAPQAMLIASSERLWALRVDGSDLPAHPLYHTTFEGGMLVSSGTVAPHSELLPAGSLITL